MEKKDTKKKILIVDDDSFLLDMYALRFTQAGFQVETGINAEQALDKIRGGLNPDVIMLDIVMPVMDGFELLEVIKNEALLKETVKIILSNLGQQSDFDKGKELGAHGYIVKANSTPSEVVSTVLEIMKQNGK